MAMAVMAVISFFGYRHYKLEAEIYSMAWKVSYNDVLPCNAINKQRGSLYSLAKRGSQLVGFFPFIFTAKKKNKNFHEKINTK